MRPQRLALLEPLLVFILTMLYIWVLRAAHPGLWMAILAVMLLSHALRRETPRRLGFTTHDLPVLARAFAPAISLLALLLVACGVLFHTIRPVGFDGVILGLAAYLPWGIAQQYILNGYFLNRFDCALPPRASAATAAAVFCLAHTPNWFLMLVTFVGGYCAALVYRRTRSLYAIGAAHAIIGFLLFLVVPDAVSHHLRVGPGWFHASMRQAPRAGMWIPATRSSASAISRVHSDSGLESNTSRSFPLKMYQAPTATSL